LVALRKKIYALIAVTILAYCLVSSIVLYLVSSTVFCLVSSIVNLSRSDWGPAHGGERVTFYNLRFAPYIYNKPTVNISMDYTPPAYILVLYCNYTVTDSNHQTVDSSIMLDSPFSSKYIINKTLTNLPNDNYTMIINAYYANGTVHTPLNSTFTVDTTFQEPRLIIISPQNQTYNTNGIEIIYSVNSKLIWSYYALDYGDFAVGDDWKYLSGNMTLNGLSQGQHRLVISVKTEANEHSFYANTAQTIYFNITKENE